MAEKWIRDAIKNPGALREKMGAKEGENISKDKLAAKEAQLKKEGAGDKKLSSAKRTLLKQIVLARTLSKMNK